MAKRSRTVLERMAVVAGAQQQPDHCVFYAVLEILKALTEKYGNTLDSKGGVVAASRYLASVMTAYSETVNKGLPDSKKDADELVSATEDLHLELVSLATQMQKTMEHPAYYLRSRPEELELYALIKEKANSVSKYDIESARALRKQIRDEQPVAYGSIKRGGRWKLASAISHAWVAATGLDIPRRKTALTGDEHYGEFPDFIKAVLAITKETTLINVDELHRGILSMGD